MTKDHITQLLAAVTITLTLSVMPRAAAGNTADHTHIAPRSATGTTADTHIVTRQEVGADKMPATISPITGTPFAMASLQRPTFPSRTVTVDKKDVDKDGKITAAINKKISQLSAKGGGRLVVPSGHWLTGRVELKSNVDLHLEEGAVLEFSADIHDYLPAVFTRHEGVEVMGAGAFIYANGAENIALTGKGTVTGPPMDVPMRTLPNGNSVVEKDIDYTMPVTERLCDGLEGRTFYRPKSFSPINCHGVLVEGVTFERSVLWNINPTYCDDVIIRGVTVNSVGTPSGDGIDISSCKNVLIEYSTLNCGDDCFTLKSGRAEDGIRVNRPTENVVIRYCLAQQGHGGITCGSETAGDIRNVYLHHCVFDGTRTGFRFKTRRNRGGGTQRVVYDNVRLINMNEAFTWDLLGTATYMGKLAQRKPPLDITPLTPTVKDIRISNFIIESTDRLLTINGIPEIPTSGIVIENGTVNTNRICKTLNDVDGLTLTRLNITATDPTVTIDDGRHITLRDIRWNVPGDTLFFNIKGEHSADISIVNGSEVTPCTGGKVRVCPPSRYEEQRDSILAQITGASIPQKSVLITQYGAKGDGKKDCKAAFDKAMKASQKSGGLRIVVPAGTYYIRGPIHFVSNTSLELAEGAVLKFAPEPELYLPMVKTSWEGTLVQNYSPFIYGYNVHDVSITGKGTIDGNAGTTFATWKKDQRTAQQLSRDMNHREEPVENRNFGKGSWLRPQLIQFYGCKNVTLSDFFMTNSPFWCVHLLQSENVVCRALSYDAKLVNNDGIDPEFSRNILIEDVHFNNGDDNVAIKSGRDNDGWAVAQPSENIVIRRCHFKGLHALVIGSEMSAGVRNVFMEDCTYAGYCKRGIYVKTNPDRGGFVENINVRNCEFDEVEDLFYVTSMYAGEGMDNSHFSTVSNLSVDGLRCNKVRQSAIVLQGTTQKPITGVSFRGVDVKETKNALSIDNAEGVTFAGCHLGEKAGVPTQVTAKDKIF